MKPEIHPKYHDVEARCACGATWKTRSTKNELHLEICSNCHPFFTGKQKLLDTEGRVERFMKKFGAQTVEGRKGRPPPRRRRQQVRDGLVQPQGAGSVRNRHSPQFPLEPRQPVTPVGHRSGAHTLGQRQLREAARLDPGRTRDARSGSPAPPAPRA